MKKIFLIVLPLLLLTATAVTAQADLSHDSTIVFVKAEQMPAYRGGDSAWIQFLQKNLQYPQKAIDKEQQGVVWVEFVVDTTGKIHNVEAVTQPAKPLVQEALRIIHLSDGNWVPAMQNGHRVKCYTKKPITFRLESGN